MKTAPLTDKVYDYYRSWMSIVLPLLLFGVASVVSTHGAVTNRRGMVINGIIELGVEGATVVLWVFTAFGFLMVTACLVLTVKKLFIVQTITTGPGLLCVPKSWWSAELFPIELPKAAWWASSYGRRLSINVVHPERTVSIQSNRLKGRKAFDEILEHVARYAVPREVILPDSSSS